MEEVLETKEGSNKIFENYYFLGGIFLVVLIIIGLFVFYHPPEKTVSIQNCGDGTFSNYCSLTKPYFCQNETLIQNVTQCGCPDSAKFSNGTCVSEYNKNGTLMSFNYLLNGKNDSLNFELYPAVLPYLLNLTRTKLYYNGELPRRDDFKLSKINDPVQDDYLSSLAVEIENLAPNSKDMQAKIAVSLVQNIPYNESQFETVLGTKVRLARYPYQVLLENQGSCEGKSELLTYLLRKMGFGVMLFYFPPEDHESVGIKCPLEYSYKGTGYCFVETTVSSPISFSEGEYLGDSGISKLVSQPQFVLMSDGISLSGNLEDYEDAKTLSGLVDQISETGSLNPLDNVKMNSLRKKYNLTF